MRAVVLSVSEVVKQLMSLVLRNSEGTDGEETQQMLQSDKIAHSSALRFTPRAHEHIYRESIMGME